MNEDIKYPVSIQPNISSGPVLIGADYELIAVLESATDWEASHIAQRLNLASKMIAKMRMMGWEEHMGRIYNPRLRLFFDDWTSAIDACIEMASD